MRNPRADHRRRRAQGERGAVLVEAAMLTPIFFLLIFGIIEFSFAMRVNLTTSVISDSGARAASISGSDQSADGQIIAAVANAASALPGGAFENVVVFKASGPDTPIPTACMTGPVSGTCNYYDASDLTLPLADFDCSSNGDQFWCPTTRLDKLSDPPDYVGIWVKVHHDFFTGFFGSGMDVTRTTIVRLEPNGF